MTDLFANSDPVQEQTPKSYYEALVGETAKFKDNESLAKGKWESDQYIRVLEKRMDDMRTEILARKETSETTAQLQALIDQLKNKPDDSEGASPPKPENEIKPGMTAEEAKAMFNDLFNQNKELDKQTNNFNSVMSKLKEQYGNNYLNVLNQKKDELGLDNEDINALARKSPTAFFNTLGLNNTTTNSMQLPRNTQRPAFSPSVPKRDWAYYEDLRKKDLRSYLSPETTVQIQKDILAMGEEAFYGNN